MQPFRACARAAFIIAWATLPVAVCSIVALVALGILKPGYQQAWILGLLILPGSVAGMTVLLSDMTLSGA